MSEERWHLSKSVSISHLLTTAALIFGAMIYLTNMDKAMAINIHATEVNSLAILELKADDRAMMEVLEKRFDRADDKMDTVLELIHALMQQGNSK